MESGIQAVEKKSLSFENDRLFSFHCFRGAAMYRFPLAFNKLHSDSSPHVAQHFPSGPISTSFPFCTSNPIMDITADGCAFMAWLISERLNPFSLVSSNVTSCDNMVYPNPSKSPP